MKSFLYKNSRDEIIGQALIEFKTYKENILEFYPAETKMSEFDVATFKRIENACFVTGMSDAHNMPGYIQESDVLAFRREGIIIAAILFNEQKNPFKKQQNLIFIEDIIVDPVYQRQSLGKILMTLVTQIAEKNFMDILLDSPPRNQKYYNQFGFSVMRRNGDLTWMAEDKDGEKYPIKKLSLRREPGINVIPKLNLSDEKEKPTTQSSPLATIDQIFYVKKLAIFAKTHTSYWYRNFLHSGEKEQALKAIKRELRIHESTITQRRVITVQDLTQIARAILKNAMIVRGSDFFGSQTTTSGMALYQTLAQIRQNLYIPKAEILIIKKLLDFEEPAYASYPALRKAVFGDRDCHSQADRSPYHYYEDFTSSLRA